MGIFFSFFFFFGIYSNQGKNMGVASCIPVENPGNHPAGYSLSKAPWFVTCLPELPGH